MRNKLLHASARQPANGSAKGAIKQPENCMFAFPPARHGLMSVIGPSDYACRYEIVGRICALSWGGAYFPTRGVNTRRVCVDVPEVSIRV